MHLSKGEEVTNVTVPSLIGRPYSSWDEINNILAESGLYLGNVYEVESTQTPGTIVEMSPGPGAEVEKGTYISVGYAAEPVSTTKVVPSLTGMTFSEATQACLERGLNVVMGDLVEDPTGTGTPGTVIRQDIDQGTEVEEGTTIVRIGSFIFGKRN